MREISLNWNPASQMMFEATGPNGVKVAFDSAVNPGDELRGFSPKIMLMLALGACTGMDVISILRKMRQEVTDYRMDIKGWEEADLPKKFDKIVVEHVLTGHNLRQDAVDRAIQLSHEKYCGVSASLEQHVEIEVTGRILEAVEVAGD